MDAEDEVEAPESWPSDCEWNQQMQSAALSALHLVDCRGLWASTSGPGAGYALQFHRNWHTFPASVCCERLRDQCCCNVALCCTTNVAAAAAALPTSSVPSAQRGSASDSSMSSSALMKVPSQHPRLGTWGSVHPPSPSTLPANSVRAAQP